MSDDTCPHGSMTGYCSQPPCIPFSSEPKNLIEKGSKHGECNRTACENIPADWYNMYTQRWYCEACAKRINAIATHRICDKR